MKELNKQGESCPPTVSPTVFLKLRRPIDHGVPRDRLWKRTGFYLSRAGNSAGARVALCRS
jgi:hypothetical protein